MAVVNETEVEKGEMIIPFSLGMEESFHSLCAFFVLVCGGGWESRGVAASRRRGWCDNMFASLFFVLHRNQYFA
jgi:hypothetical protein